MAWPSTAGRLAGKVALITGGGAGIGAATARIFVAEGAAVLLVDADRAALQRTAAALCDHATRVRCFEADVADAARADGAVRAAIDAFGRLDILVNNAAMRVPVALADATPEQWQAIVGVNLVGAAGYARAALPALRASGRGALRRIGGAAGAFGFGQDFAAAHHRGA